MTRWLRFLVPVVVGLVLVGAARTSRAAEYAVDLNHSSISFKIRHMGISWVHGRFNDFGGRFTVDRMDPARDAFNLSIKVASIDTNNAQRDAHLRNADFFNAPEFAQITFKSTKVKAGEDGLEVTGDFTMHGVTKPITFMLKGGQEVELPKGIHQIGFSTELTIKRTEFGMDKGVGPVGDEVHISIGLEGTRK